MIRTIYGYMLQYPIEFTICLFSLALVLLAVIDIDWITLFARACIGNKKLKLTNKQVRITMALSGIVWFLIVTMPFYSQYISGKTFFLICALVYISAGVFYIKPLLAALLCLGKFRLLDFSPNTIRVFMIFFGICLLILCWYV